MKKLINDYKIKGFINFPLFTQKDHDIIYKFGIKWFYKNCNIKDNDIHKFPIEKYHIWSKKLKIDHNVICNAKNRYVYPALKVSNIIKRGKKVKLFLKMLGFKDFKMFDDGWGFVGFRLMRPGFNDGYPLSKKDGGQAKNVVSCWFPIVGRGKNETIGFIPNSNNKKYSFYKPKNTKFTKDEYRLRNKKKLKDSIYNPSIKSNEVMIYTSATLHTEQNSKLKNTRFNLEFRYQAID